MEERIKSALDSFENDDYMDAKDNIKNFVKDKVNSYLKDKIGVESIGSIDDSSAQTKRRMKRK